MNRSRSLSQQSYLPVLKNAVNAVYQELCSYREWPFFQKSGYVNTIPPVTIGTLTGIAGTNVLTGAGTAFTLENEGWYVQFGSDQVLYQVTSVDPTAQTLSVMPNITLTSLTQGYSLFPLSYPLPGDFRIPEPVTSFNISPVMTFMGSRELLSRLPNAFFSNPKAWSLLYGAGNPTVPQIAFWPLPNVSMAVQFWYLPQLPDLLNDSDPVLIPSNYRRAIVEGAMSIFYRDVLDDPGRAQICGMEYVKIRTQMCADYSLFDDPPKLRPMNFRGIARRRYADPIIERMLWGS
ncbi:MAG: hypothetical protein M0041_03405 [Nitrospiraceae bacterium]|nr:hypothetical protein [Nitrospiraceae bacterium]